MKQMQIITLDVSKRLQEFGRKQAEKEKLNVAIAIVDNAGHLISFERMDSCAIVTIEVAIGKARSAAYLKAPSKLFEDFVNAGQVSMNMVPNILPLQGGIPIVNKGNVIGAVGVSGGEGIQDQSLALKIADFFNTL